MTSSRSASDDARHCARITREHARTFHLASHFLPERKRRAAYAVYAFCRVADDMVDAATCDDAGPVRRELDAFSRSLVSAFDGAPKGPIFRELHWAQAEFAVSPAPLLALVGAVADDLTPRRYESWADLRRYCEGVASTVGELCAQIFGVPVRSDERERALRHARTLGVAMQLTNILRDVGEDAARGRCYLPDEDLARAGLDREAVLRGNLDPYDSRWRELLSGQIVRARALYDEAAPGLALVDRDARRCAILCAEGYASILDALEAINFDSINHRARVSHARRAALLVTACIRPLPEAASPRPAARRPVAHELPFAPPPSHSPPA